MAVVTASLKPGSGRLSLYGKRRVAHAMYSKGTSFLAAAVLLDRRGAYEAVVLHLLCQGVEVVLKALLLFRNYDKYAPELKKIGHNLEKLARTVVREFRTRPLSPAVVDELKGLSRLYSKHLLRYGTVYDILVDPATIPSRLVFKKIIAVLRLANRHVAEKNHAT